ncbi:MAG TPA: tetratricopeptide repeat protein [Caulobacteraceae bacterium]|nr:tetratricopeptide repeat protein [Caulobacteraceae bacterium]
MARAAESPGGQALLEAALEHYKSGRREEAETGFRRAIAEAPGEPTALFLLGLVRFEAGDAEEATQLLEQVVALRPDHSQSWLTLANMRHWRGDSAGAAEAYRRVTRIEPDHAAALTGLAHTLLSSGDETGALAAGEAAIALAPADAAAQLALAAVLANLGRPSEAAAAYGVAASLNPDDATAQIGLAVALLQLNQPEPAQASAERAVVLDPNVALAWFTLGTALRARGRFAAATPALERAVALDPDRAAAHASLGAVYLELDRLGDAEIHLLHALQLSPDDTEPHASLSTLYCRADRFEQARGHAEAALALDPSLSTPRQNLAGILAREGRDEEAKRHRDLAFAERNLSVASAPDPILRVLMLTTTDSGNMPDRYLLPAERFTRIYWFIEYAQPDQAKDLPPHDVVFNAIADEDAAGPTAAPVARFLESCTLPVFNRPDRVSRTRRDLAPSLFDGIEGLVTPQVARIRREALADHGPVRAIQRAGAPTPLLVRPIGSHGGHRLALARSDAEVAEAAAAVIPGRDHYVTAFHDFRSADGLYRKYRMIYVDRRPYPYHLAVGPDWMVHYDSSGTAEHPDRRDEERRFLEDPEAALGPLAMGAIRAAGARLDLDFCGIDFSVLPDGRVLLFEANATMLVHREPAEGPLAYKNAYVERIVDAFQAMLIRAASN